jgi:uncharacterized protein DUF3224
MKATTVATFASWDEAPWDEPAELPKMTRTRATWTYDGDLTGEGTSESLMIYHREGADFLGQERITGTLHGRKGTFAVHTIGMYADGVARCDWRIVPRSGTGELEGLDGRGRGEAPAGNQMTIHFEYVFPQDD